MWPRNLHFIVSAILLGALLGSCSHLPSYSGNFRVHRWNQGSSAEAKPLFTAEVSDGEARKFLETGEVKGEKPLFPGCFLVVYQPNGRAIASRDALVARGTHKVCLEGASALAN